MPTIITFSDGSEEVSGNMTVHLTMRECIELMKECKLCCEDVGEWDESNAGQRTAVTAKEAFRALVVTDVDEPFSEDVVFCTSSEPVLRPAPTPEPEAQEVAAPSEGAPSEGGPQSAAQSRRGSQAPSAAGSAAGSAQGDSRRGSQAPTPEGEMPGSRRGSTAGAPVASQSRRGSTVLPAGENAAAPTIPLPEEPAGLPKVEEEGQSDGPAQGTLYTLSTPLTFQEALEGMFRVAYIAQVKGTEKPVVPVLTSTMDVIEALLAPTVASFKEVQATAAHKVKRNREVAAGGLTDEQQALVLELHTLVDEDGNGTVEKEELEAAVGDKRGKMFDKLDVDKNGNVDPLEFLDFFEKMALTRGRKAAEGLLSHVHKGVQKLLSKKPNEASAEMKETGDGDQASEDDS